MASRKQVARSMADKARANSGPVDRYAEIPDVGGDVEHIPAQMDFMQGYRRDEGMTHQLGSALVGALLANPNQRLGQLLTNLARGADLWNVHDEDWLELLKVAAQPQ